MAPDLYGETNMIPPTSRPCTSSARRTHTLWLTTTLVPSASSFQFGPALMSQCSGSWAVAHQATANDPEEKQLRISTVLRCLCDVPTKFNGQETLFLPSPCSLQLHLCLWKGKKKQGSRSLLCSKA